MKVLKSLNEIILFRNECEKKNFTIGFAPTMGALHKGHISLYEKAKSENNDCIISSIFINPTQFNNTEDLEKYPRNIDLDLKILKESNIVDAVYTPSVEDIYPFGIYKKTYDFDGLENQMEGKFRPGHFDGVGTVVEKLFNQVKPQNAYFGEKDFQQLQIIKKLNEKINLNINIHQVSIYREKNGLAMSSRNERLTSKEREEAGIIFQSLKIAKEMLLKEDFSVVHSFILKQFTNTNFKLEYFSLASEINLKEITKIEKTNTNRLFIAVFCRDIRLIDTIHV